VILFFSPVVQPPPAAGQAWLFSFISSIYTYFFESARKRRSHRGFEAF